MNKGKIKVKTKDTKLTPVTITVVSLGALLMMFSIGIYPNLMSNSVTSNNSYTISYNSNGGSGSMNNQKILTHTAVQLRKNKFKKDGYSFNGWRVKRSDNTWFCYVDNTKTISSWTDISYCNKYGYVLYKDNVYVQDIVDAGNLVTLYADWVK